MCWAKGRLLIKFLKGDEICLISSYHCHKYAYEFRDDSKVRVTDISEEDHNIIQEGLRFLLSWCNGYGMKSNCAKCKAVLSGNKHLNLVCELGTHHLKNRKK